MTFLRKKWWLALLSSILLALAIPVIHKSLPIMRERECYRSFFPLEKFQERLKEPAAPWMLSQLKSDLAPFSEKKITTQSIDNTYHNIYKKLGTVHKIYHFRILDNQLYKYILEGTPFSDTDTETEKALKTLLMYSKVPDCDFILCGVDGVPESYVPPDYFLTDDPIDQAPILAQAKNRSLAPQYIVLVPDHLSLSQGWYKDSLEILQANQEISWEEKSPIAVWRGGLSDAGEPTDGRVAKNYANTPRFSLCKLGAQHPEAIDAGFAGLDSNEMEKIALKQGLLKGPLSKKAHLLGKYLPVLDGQMCTYPGYQWRLLSNSVCFKQESPQVQWFYEALTPYVHYIPIKNDMSDLLEKINWAKENEQKVIEIAKAATEFAAQNLRYEDLYFYLHLAFVEYAKFQNIDFAEIKKETRSDPHWKCIQYRKRLALKKSYDRFWTKMGIVRAPKTSFRHNDLRIDEKSDEL